MDMKRTSIELCVYHINHSITADLVWVKEEDIQFETNNSSKLASLTSTNSATQTFGCKLLKTTVL